MPLLPQFAASTYVREGRLVVRLFWLWVFSTARLQLAIIFIVATHGQLLLTWQFHCAGLAPLCVGDSLQPGLGGAHRAGSRVVATIVIWTTLSAGQNGVNIGGNRS